MEISRINPDFDASAVGAVLTFKRTAKFPIPWREYPEYRPLPPPPPLSLHCIARSRRGAGTTSSASSSAPAAPRRNVSRRKRTQRLP